MKKVYFIGSGPGDVELLTLKAVRILEKADIILYDNLVSKEVLEYAKKANDVIYVGKKIGDHSNTQFEIHKLFLKYYQMDKLIIRLKGGDPVIFGRLDEEIQFLRKRNIPIEIIPGVTTASSAASELEFSLTQRESGRAVVLLSGYSQKYTTQNGLLAEYDWDFLAKYPHTLVFYMGFYNLQKICKKLIENGMPSDTRIAVISNSSLPNQKKIVGTIQNIKKLVEYNQLTFPAIIIIGNTIPKHNHVKYTLPITKNRKQGILALFHGASILQRSDELKRFTSEIQEENEQFECTYGFLTEKFHPNYKEAMDYLIYQKKLETIYIWPVFLLPGKHLNIDIPDIHQKFIEQYKNQANIKLLQAPDINRDLFMSLKKQLFSQLKQ